MEIHVIATILLEYCGTLTDWCTTRTCCKDLYNIVFAKPYDLEVLGQGSFIKTDRCMACHKRTSSAKWLVYKGLPPSHRLYAVTCSHYTCRMSAIFSMLDYLKQHNIHVLSSPFQAENTIDIPRSSGKITKGSCVTDSLQKIRGMYYIMARWSEGFDVYNKAIPWPHYFTVPPRFIFENKIH